MHLVIFYLLRAREICSCSTTGPNTEQDSTNISCCNIWLPINLSSWHIATIYSKMHSLFLKLNMELWMEKLKLFWYYFNFSMNLINKYMLIVYYGFS
jgi:hypothetical protein